MDANVYEVNPFSIDKVEVITLRGPAGDPVPITDGSITDAKLVQTGGVLSETKNLSTTHNAFFMIGGAPIESRLYLEEGNASGTDLYFKGTGPLNFYVDGTLYSKSWADTVSETGATTVTSPYYVPDCIKIPNNYGLVFDVTDKHLKFIERAQLKSNHVVLFVNAYGRAEQPHQTISEYQKYNIEKNIKRTVTNVKMFGAYGNGSADDSVAIQRAIDYAHENGGVVFFPKGTYLLSSVHFNSSDPGTASALIVYDGMTLLGDEGAVLKAGHSAVTHMIFTNNAAEAAGYTGCQNVVFSGLSFDSNSSLTGNITALNLSHSSNVRIQNCRFTGGRGWHSIEINSSKNVHVNGCVFTGNANTEDIQIDAASGDGNLGRDDGTVCDNIEISECEFSVNGSPAIGNHNDAAHKDIRIHDNFFQGTPGNSGYISFVASQTLTDIYSNTFKDAIKGITFENASNGGSVTGNRFINVSTPMTGGLIRNDNIIDNVLESIFSSKGFLFPEVVPDLNTVMTGQAIGSIRMCQYSNTATSNRPSNDSGICLSGRNTGSGAYGWQIAFTNNGFYWRKYSSSSFQAWQSLT